MHTMNVSRARTELDDALCEGDLAARIEAAIGEACAQLRRAQQADGHWAFELEADATIPSEFILLNHFLGEIDDEIERKLARYIRARQADHGGWPLFYRGDLDISASVKAYFALKLVGDSPDAPHMRRARAAILARGGAAESNVFTRIALALFGQVPWRAVPSMPVEIMLLPRWAPFHLGKISYWSRTVLVPLLVLMALRPQAQNPRKIGIAELFAVPPDRHGAYLVNPTGARLGAALLGLDKLLKAIEPRFPLRARRRAIERARSWVMERLNGEDGLGGIFPAMANAVMMMRALGMKADDPAVQTARRAIRKLLVVDGDSAYCQPCLSPVWDTALAALAAMEAGEPGHGPTVRKALDWLAARQVTDVAGDWAERRPGLRPGGWAFQYENPHYPDVDDTAAVVMALDRARAPAYGAAIARAAEWVEGMQSDNGGWGAFDADNTAYHLNHIPFADHGALLDAPTVDVSARCVSMLAQLGHHAEHPAVARALDYLRREQEPDGSWFGRWGTNYIYGTWSALSAFNAAGEDMQAPHIRKAVAWLIACQNDDGGWGEDGATYWADRRGECKASTASQTAWALLGLMAAGEVGHEAVRRGIAFLLHHPRDDGRWREPWYTAVGFPRVFYLRYHGYARYFPLWALARYRNLMRSNSRRVGYGM
jgi:squalene-hopene/tetraprenyl-beta-curcumene cyclase